MQEREPRPAAAAAPADELARRMRPLILEESKRANVGHIGSALSIVDILAVLYGGVLRISKPDDPDRDRFILSKGHAALVFNTQMPFMPHPRATTANTLPFLIWSDLSSPS